MNIVKAMAEHHLHPSLWVSSQPSRKTLPQPLSDNPDIPPYHCLICVNTNKKPHAAFRPALTFLSWLTHISETHLTRQWKWSKEIATDNHQIIDLNMHALLLSDKWGGDAGEMKSTSRPTFSFMENNINIRKSDIFHIIHVYGYNPTWSNCLDNV